MRATSSGDQVRLFAERFACDSASRNRLAIKAEPEIDDLDAILGGPFCTIVHLH
jgi:hypothetical protein